MSVIDSIKALPAQLRANEIPVPKGLTEAVKASGWKTVPSSTPVAEAAQKLASAKDEQSFLSALEEYTRLKAAYDAVVADGPQAVAAQALGARLYEQVAPLADIVPTVVEKFNQDVPAFTRAAEQIPNLDGVKPMDIDVATAQSLSEARTAAEVLRTRFELFKSLVRLLGHDAPGGTSREDALSTLLYLCEPVERRLHDNTIGMDDVTASAVWTAADQIRMYALGDSRLSLTALAPFIVAPSFGWDLSLTTPHEADERRRRVFGV